MKWVLTTPEIDDPAARELLDDHRVGRQVEPHPAVLLGDRDPEQPELLHLLDDRLRELVVGVVVLGVREDLLVHELPDHLEDGLLLFSLLVERRVATAMGSVPRAFGGRRGYRRHGPPDVSRGRVRGRGRRGPDRGLRRAPDRGLRALRDRRRGPGRRPVARGEARPADEAARPAAGAAGHGRRACRHRPDDPRPRAHGPRGPRDRHDLHARGPARAATPRPAG